MAKSFTRKITRTGRHSYGVLLPASWVKALGWRFKQKVTLKKRGSKITIEDWKPKSRNRKKGIS